MIDADLAALYAVETKQLVRAVKRNAPVELPGDRWTMNCQMVAG
jgi:hypothetical protein